ncbi:hypothetical protein DPMN_168208 [Dreissena polymorpha]|uniref:Uncharacterized protein n=1 Tax=Dreissena polymorpha TaxID=45954 RepID=A0A9D4F081_DREPO|nr:hypothetical protein DPMN_168208 [Dreissena polymorpha]
MRNIIFTALILIGIAPCVTCQTGANFKDLRTKLFVTDSYDYRVRPTNDQKLPTEISVDLHLLAINELNEAKQTMKTTAYLALIWTDAFLKWKPSDYGNIQDAFWPQGEVWKPDIALKNSNLEYKELGVPSLNVLNRYDGTVEWRPFQVFESSCSLDITHFPFDYQTCYMKFEAWSYLKAQVIMIGGSNGVKLNDYEPNAAWEIIDSTWDIVEDNEDSTISFSITMKRKPLYFMLSVIIPITTLAILNLCVSVLPTSSGEKAGYAITVFLAFTVFLTVISSSLPQSSDSVALIAVFLIIQTICSTLTTVLALALLRMSSFDQTVAIPRILIFFMRCLKCKSCSKEFNIAPNRVVSIKDTESKIFDMSSTGDVEYSWKEVVNCLDVVLFVVNASIFVSSWLGCFMAAKNSKP